MKPSMATGNYWFGDIVPSYGVVTLRSTDDGRTVLVRGTGDTKYT